MFSWLDKAFRWMKINAKWVLLGLALIFLSIIGFSWYRKNRLIRKLRNQLIIMRTKLALDKLAFEYNLLTDKLSEVRKRDAFIEIEMQRIEEATREKLNQDMTASEIVSAFKRIGLVNR